MHIKVTNLIALALARNMVTWTGASNSTSWWYSNVGGQYTIPLAIGGCQDLRNCVPRLRELCIDYGNRCTHFYFNGQGKRCLGEVVRTWLNCNGGDCWMEEWNEVGCMWKVAEGAEAKEGK